MAANLAPLLGMLFCIVFVVSVDAAVAALAVAALVCLVAFAATFAWVKWAFPRVTEGVVGFFHPFADGGGGGERVLWAAIQALQRSHPRLRLVLYCGEGCTPASLCDHAAARFNLAVAPTFAVVPLRSRPLLLPERYPRFTMVGQALGSVRVACEALRQCVPALWVDTTGWAFPYPLARLAGARVAAYVHYPTISTDMLGRVQRRQAGYANREAVAGSLALTAAKLGYYHALAAVYGAVGGAANVAMVNSSWTRRHIEALWWRRRRPALVYPPCDTAALRALPLDRRLKRLYVLSVAQFRPEKDHELQLRAFAAARRRAARHPDARVAGALAAARLQLVGGCRGAGDEARVAALRALAAELGLGEGEVEFRVNVSFPELRALLGDAVAGLHTMADEHFGISVVEYMAAGLVPIVHDSGGPREDIVVPEAEGGGRDGGSGLLRTGFRCVEVEEYADALEAVLGMEQGERQRMAAAARRRAAAFSDERFQAEFLACLEPVLPRPPS